MGARGIDIPLVALHGPGATLLWHDGSITRERFLAEAHALADRLPARGHPLNLCEDRYGFILAFAAALIRGHTSLLPPNRSEAAVREIAQDYPGSYVLYDQGGVPAELPGVRVVAGAAMGNDVGMPAIDADLVALIAFTSGSTGRAKPNAKTWASLVGTTQMLRRRFLDELGGTANIVATVPPQHMYGMETSVLLCLQGGAAVYGGRPFYPADVAAALASLPEPRVLITTPVHLRACVQGGIAFPPLAFIMSATAPLAPELAAEAEARYRAPVLEIYGCTETASIASRRTVEGDAWRLYEGMRMTVDHGAATVSGLQLPEPTTLADVIELVDKECFLLLGRNEDMLNIAGKRASLADLNLKLQKVRGVVDGVIFVPEVNGRPADRLAALVVAPGMTREQILAALRESIDPVFLPRPLYLVDALPRSETSKLPRQALLDLLRREGARA